MDTKKAVLLLFPIFKELLEKNISDPYHIKLSNEPVSFSRVSKLCKLRYDKQEAIVTYFVKKYLDLKSCRLKSVEYKRSGDSSLMTKDLDVILNEEASVACLYIGSKRTNFDLLLQVFS